MLVSISMCSFEGINIMAWWLSWLERRPVTAEVEGSNPFRVATCEYPSTHDASYLIIGVLAQLGEHLPYKQRVTGSSPVGPISSISLVGKVVGNIVLVFMPMWLNWQSS